MVIMHLHCPAIALLSSRNFTACISLVTKWCVLFVPTGAFTYLQTHPKVPPWADLISLPSAFSVSGLFLLQSLTDCHCWITTCGVGAGLWWVGGVLCCSPRVPARRPVTTSGAELAPRGGRAAARLGAPRCALASCNLSRSALPRLVTDVCQTQLFPAVSYHLPSTAGGTQCAVCYAGPMAAGKSSSFARLSTSSSPK